MQAVILAAGKGTRLHPITLTRSKAMAPVAGKPMVERVMETLVENDVREFIIVVSQEEEELQHYFLNRSGLPVSVQFVTQAERLGMAHALSLAAPYLQDTFVMSACDNLVSAAHIAELLATHQRKSAEATLSLLEIELARVSTTGVVVWDHERIRRIVEKPTPEEAPSTISSLPLYVFSPRLLDYLPKVKRSSRGEYELQDAIQMLIDEGGHVTGAFAQGRLQLTNSRDLLALNRHYLVTADGASVVKPHRVGQHTHLITPLRIEEGVTIGPGSVIGPRVYIEQNCRIGANVLIKDAVILRDSVIEDGRQVIGEVVS